MCYANLAFKRVRNGSAQAEVEPYLTRSLDAADKTEDWRKDRIKIRVAQVYAYLGREQAAAALEQGVEEISENGKVARIEAIQPILLRHGSARPD